MLVKLGQAVFRLHGLWQLEKVLRIKRNAIGLLKIKNGKEEELRKEMKRKFFVSCDYCPEN